MTVDQAALVRRNFERIRPSGELFGRLFFDRLLAIDPALAERFTRPVEQQAAITLQMLGVVLGRLPEIDAVAPALNALGARHVAYGVVDDDYETFGQALMGTLAATLGNDFDDATRAAWDSAYELITCEMRAGAAQAQPINRDISAASSASSNGLVT
jgi:hemoglobin-like flavoprotein